MPVPAFSITMIMSRGQAPRGYLDFCGFSFQAPTKGSLSLVRLAGGKANADPIPTIASISAQRRCFIHSSAVLGPPVIGGPSLCAKTALERAQKIQDRLFVRFFEIVEAFNDPIGF